jgi:Flp pilus assembly pilin Flp
MPLLAHHVEINLFDLVVIEPETMPEHALLAAVTAVVVALVVYGIRGLVRDTRAWIASRRTGSSAAAAT